jgi:membrane protein EpsK
MGAANAALAVALALWSGWGYISIAIASAIVLTAKNTFFTPLYSAYILKLPRWTFLPSLLPGVLGCLAVSAGAFWVSSTWTLTDWGQLVLVALITSGICMFAGYFLVLGADERRLLRSEIRRRLQR